MSKNTKIIILLAGIILVLAGALIVLRGGGENTWVCENGQWVKQGNPSDPMPAEPCGNNEQNTQEQPKNIQSAAEIQENQPQAQELTLIINFGEGNIQQTSLPHQANITALELTKQGAAKMGLTIKTEDSAYGIMLKKIGEMENGDEGKYWLYYYNGETAPIGADQLELKTGDRVEWKFEPPSF